MSEPIFTEEECLMAQIRIKEACAIMEEEETLHPDLITQRRLAALLVAQKELSRLEVYRNRLP